MRDRGCPPENVLALQAFAVASILVVLAAAVRRRYSRSILAQNQLGALNDVAVAHASNCLASFA